MAGCGGQNDTAEDETIQCGIMDWQEPSDLEIFPKPALGEWKQYSSLTTMVMDLNAGNVEYLLMPSSVANYLKSTGRFADDRSGRCRRSYGIRMAVRSEDTELYQLLQEGFRRFVRMGSLDTLVDTYITNISVSSSAESAQTEGETSYVVGVTGDLPPLDYVAADRTPAGFNVALMDAIAEELDVSFTPFCKSMRMHGCLR